LLVYSKTKEEYNTQYQSLRGRLNVESSSVEQSTKWVKYLDVNIHEHRHQFVRAFVEEYSFNLEREGSSPAESNHSSYVARIGPVSVEEPTKMVEQTLLRHSEICCERNEEIFCYYSECIAEVQLNNSIDPQDRAALLFCHHGHTKCGKKRRCRLSTT
jgi:hypothetical protein